MSNLELVSAIAQIVEAIILIASVFYLSLQVKQANLLSRSETRRVMMKGGSPPNMGRKRKRVLCLFAQMTGTPLSTSTRRSLERLSSTTTAKPAFELWYMSRMRIRRQPSELLSYRLRMVLFDA